MADGKTSQTGGSSLSDMLSAVKNLVLAVNAAAQNYLNVQGLATSLPIPDTTPAVVKASGGRLCSVSVTALGSATGTIYDGSALSQTSKPIYIIPVALGIYIVNLPVNYGIVVIPGAGQRVSVSYS